MPVPEDTIRDGLLDDLISRIQTDVPNDKTICDALDRVDRKITRILAETEPVRSDRIDGSTARGLLSLPRKLAARPAFLTAACIVIVAFVVTMVAWLTRGDEQSGIVYADVIQPFREANTIRFAITVTSGGIPEQVMECIGADPGLMRCTASDENGGMVLIMDLSRGKMLTLMPEKRTATMMSVPLQSPYYFLEELLKTMNDEAEPVGQRQIDGQWAVGFRVTYDHMEQIIRYMEQVIWADRDTGLPIRIEHTIEAEGPTGTPVRQTAVMSDFAFDVKVDESQFTLDVPDGYQLQELELLLDVDVSIPSEQDLIEFLRLYAESLEGRFPPELTMRVITDIAQPPTGDLAAVMGPGIKATLKGTRALQFVGGLKAANDWYYAGRGVMLDALDSPIFRWRPDGSEVYRVCYADLTVREVSPNALPEMKAFEGPVTADEVLKVYKNHRKEACRRYIAVVRDKIGKQPRVWIQHKDGSLIRMDWLWKYKSDPAGDDFDSPYQWFHVEGKSSFFIVIADTQHEYSIIRSMTKGWEVSQSPHLRAEYESTAFGEGVADLGWPEIYFTNRRVYDDEYAREHSLICLERLSVGHISENGKVHLPCRIRFYLDPQRSYICRRIEEIRQLDAPWQKDKSWLEGVDPAAIMPESTTLTEVTKFTHIDDGLWYPARVEKRTIRRNADGTSSVEGEEIKTIHIDTDRAIPEGIFDITRFEDQPPDSP